MKAGDIVRAVNDMDCEIFALRHELYETKVLAQRLLTNNLTTPLSNEEISLIKQSKLELYRGEIKWHKK